ELVLQLLAKGTRVAAVDINEASLQETAELAGSKKEKLSTHVVNIADKAVVEALPEQVVAAHGVVDGIINNAGIIQPFVRISELDYATIERVMNVNFYGMLYMTKAFLPYLRTRPEAHIANVSSMGGFLPVPGQTVYGAAKAAVKLFTEGLRSELLDTNIKVTVVFPGAIGTNIAKNSGLGNMMPAENGNGNGNGNGNSNRRSIQPLAASKAGAIIIDGIEGDRYRVLVGSDARLMDLLYRVHQKFAADFIFKQMKSLL
ncbi:MAG: SDR family NAD(P)-dependent oxidoreductase, partial [Anaerolineales bacterium]|nr:SDR family NAD(P)-dependent oxidoreductase [Anaerolineales bacterium]